MEGNLPHQEMDLTHFVRLNIKRLQSVGYFVPEFRNKFKQTIYYIYAAIFVTFMFTLCLLSQIIAFIKAFGNIEQMTEVSFLLFTNIVQCFKISCFVLYSRNIWELVHGMNREIFQPTNEAQKRIFLIEIEKSKLITTLFSLACTITCMMWSIAPFLDKETSDLRLPLSGWYPFNTENSPVFELVYIYQILATWISGIGDITWDTFVSGLIMFISAQLSVLNNQLENMKCNDKKLLNSTLTRCIIHHKNILEFADKFTYLFTSGMTAQFLIAVIIMCMSMFQMSLVAIPSFEFFAMLLYQICMLTEIYLWCFFGNDVIAKSDQLTQSAYMCEWLDTPMEFKNNLIIFMTRTQFPLRMYASAYFSLSMNTFKTITKSSYTYFAVLNQVHTKNLQ